MANLKKEKEWTWQRGGIEPCTFFILLFLLLLSPFFQGLYFIEEIQKMEWVIGLVAVIWVLECWQRKILFPTIKTWAVAFSMSFFYFIPMVLGRVVNWTGAWNCFLRYCCTGLVFLFLHKKRKIDRNSFFYYYALVCQGFSRRFWRWIPIAGGGETTGLPFWGL